MFLGKVYALIWKYKKSTRDLYFLAINSLLVNVPIAHMLDEWSDGSLEKWR